LNETRKIPLKHELSDFYSEKRPRIRSPHEKNTIGQRPNATIGGPLEGRYGERSRNSSVISLEQRNIEKKHYQNNTLFEPKKEYKPNQEKAASFDTNVNMVDISREGFSEYQKAYVRKMQRERELEIYSQILSKSSSDQNREDYMSKSNPEFYIESRKDNLRNNFKNPKEGKTSAPSPNPDETWRLENFPNLDHIEDKIYELEQNLDNYSRKLRASIERQQDNLLINRNVKRGYEALENSNKFYKKKKCYKPSAYELMRDENNRNISSQSHLKYSEIAKGNDIEKTMDLGNTKKSSVVRQYRSPHANKEMKQELEILRYFLSGHF